MVPSETDVRERWARTLGSCDRNGNENTPRALLVSCVPGCPNAGPWAVYGPAREHFTCRCGRAMKVEAA